MDINVQYCPNHDCPDYGKVGAGNIGVARAGDVETDEVDILLYVRKAALL